MSNFSYPSAPAVNVDELVKVSDSYRTNVLKVLFSILVFILGYLFVFAISLLLVYYGAYAAIGIIVTKIHWLTILLAGGILMVVVMFFVFLVKFFFKVKKDDDPSTIEITEEEHPKLFEFVAKVCEETKAPFPKKIVLSPRVNASVFYNSSFLSMFFPVRKNLEIGLGLVNSVNISEFKAIVAHEFGHFSQSSTRLGSYVYRFHKIIHNLLYDNDGWESTLHSMSSVHYIISIFGHLTIFMVQSVIRFLLLLFKLINRNYMALSREMEFHADSVAVSVSGNDSIINALYRIEFAQEAYDYTLRCVYNYNTTDVHYPKNFFTLQSRSIDYLARQNNLDLVDGLPIINTDIARKNLLENRVQYKDIWATHPPISEREKSAKRIPVPSITVAKSPWELFSNPEKLQERLSLKLVELNASNNNTISNDDLIAFMKKTEQEREVNPVYLDFYSYATATAFVPQINDSDVISQVAKLSFSELFNHDVIQKLKRHNKNLYDVGVLKAIKEGQIEAKYFEFDGKNYKRKEADAMMAILQKDIDISTEWLEQHKKQIANWFYAKAQEVDPLLSSSYYQLMKFREMNMQKQKSCADLFEEIVQFYHKELTKSIAEDDLSWIRKKIGEFYDVFTKISDSVVEEHVPAILYQENVLETSYHASVFKEPIKNPINSPNLDGFVPFVNALEALLFSWSQIDFKAFNLTVKTQDEILKSLSVL